MKIFDLNREIMGKDLTPDEADEITKKALKEVEGKEVTIEVDRGRRLKGILKGGTRYDIMFNYEYYIETGKTRRFFPSSRVEKIEI